MSTNIITIITMTITVLAAVRIMSANIITIMTMTSTVLAAVRIMSTNIITIITMTSTVLAAARIMSTNMAITTPTAQHLRSVSTSWRTLAVLTVLPRWKNRSSILTA